MNAIVLAVGGGKGGTGKSVISVQLGISLARLGLRVVLIDADPQGGNLHTFFGLEEPAISFEWILEGQGEPQRAVLPTGVKQLGLVAGIRGEMREQLSEEELGALAVRMGAVDADVAIWDVGSGCDPWQTILFERADFGLLVTQPEPTCIEKDYRFFRHVCRWRLSRVPTEHSLPASGWLPVPWLASVMRVDAEHARALQQQLRRAPLLLLVNEVHAPEDRTLGEEMIAAFRRFFGVYGAAVGWLEYDERLWLSVRERRPLFLEYPESRWVEQLQVVTTQLLYCMQREDWSKPLEEDDEYSAGE